MRRSTALFVSSGLALFAAALPIISVFAAGLIANAFECQLNEGMVQSCVVAGRNIGPLLYNMFVMGWLFILSFLYIPVAIALAIAAIVILRRGRYNPAANRPVGGVYLALIVAAMIFPIAQDVSLVIALVAGLFWWLRHRGQPPSTAPDEHPHRPLEDVH